MDQRTPQDMHYADVMAAFEVVSEFTLTRRTLPPSDSPNDRFERLASKLQSYGKRVFLFLLVLVVFEIGCGALGYYVKSNLLVSISNGAIGASLLLWTAYMLATSVAYVPGVIKIFRAPFKPLLQLVKHSIKEERSYLDRLASINVSAVKHVLAHYRNERNAMEKRGSSLSGAIDKIGLFTALGGVALLYLGLKEFAVGHEWIGMLVPVIAVFHFMNFLALDMYAKFDRIIVMLECSINTRG